MADPTTAGDRHDPGSAPTGTAAETPAERAARLHGGAIVIDGHNDVLIPIADGRLRFGEWTEVPAPSGWQAPVGYVPSPVAAFYGLSAHTDWFQTVGLYDLPRMAAGGVTAGGYAIFVEGHHLDRALHRGLELAAAFRRTAREYPGRFRAVTSVDDIHRTKADGAHAGILAMEGFEPLAGDLALLDVYHDLGLRLAGLTHSRRNPFADGTQPDTVTGGLTALGRAAVRRMNELGIVIDLAHLSREGIRDVLDHSAHPVVHTHTSPRRAFEDPAPGELTYQGYGRVSLDRIAGGGGVVGVIAWGQPDLAAVLDDIDWLVATVGPDHVAVGTDFFGVETSPAGFTGAQDFPALTRGLVDRGHSDEVILGVLGGNLLRVFTAVWR